MCYSRHVRVENSITMHSARVRTTCLPCSCTISRACLEVDNTEKREDTYAQGPRVWVFWDFDNIRPQKSESAADAVRRLEEAVAVFGDVQRMNLFANHSSILGVPAWNAALQEKLGSIDAHAADGTYPPHGNVDAAQTAVASSMSASRASAAPAGFGGTPRKPSKRLGTRGHKPLPSQVRAHRESSQARWAREYASSKLGSTVLHVDGVRLVAVSNKPNMADRALRECLSELLLSIKAKGGRQALDATSICMVSNDGDMMTSAVRDVRKHGAQAIVVSNKEDLRDLGAISCSWLDLGAWKEA